MSAFRSILLSMTIVALVPPVALRGASNTGAYLGGSVKSIPINVIGTLDVTERGELRFDYGAPVSYKLPCSQITSTSISQDETRHILHKIPVPSLLPNRKKQTLTVNFKDTAGVNGTMNFELTAEQASALLETIAIAKATPSEATFSTQSPDWWGDKYWKTNRNLSGWEGGAPSAGQTAQNGPGGIR